MLDWTLLVVPVLLLFLLSWRLAVLLRPTNRHGIRSVAIIVLGDVGRSPRMMYHAESFASNNFMTYLIGYDDTKPIPSLTRLAKFKLKPLPKPPRLLRVVPFLIAGPLKVLHQIFHLLHPLLLQPPEFIIVQNPPSIPTLAVVWLVSKLRGCKVIIDWHNLGYTILALKLGPNHRFVRIAKWLERTFGRSAYAHLFVTKALRDSLVENWDLQGHKVVLHDRPPRHFHHATPQETHTLFRDLQPAMFPIIDFLPPYDVPASTPLTSTESALKSGTVVRLQEQTFIEVREPYPRGDRPALLVSSTSWTPDEDFGILLDAMEKYEGKARTINSSTKEKSRLPKLLVIVTGKGDQRDYYMRKVTRLQKDWKWVKCLSLWLEAKDYPTLLGSADLGVSLHSSSSKMDLPMKVVDMFGCGLPVCALGFDCIGELVVDGVNGLIFNNADQLADQLAALLTAFPNSHRLSEMSQTVRKANEKALSNSPHHVHPEWEWGSWDNNWENVMLPLLSHDSR